MTKQLQVDHAVVSAKQLRVSAVSMESLKTKFEAGPFDREAQPMLVWFRTLPICSYCRLHTYT